MKFLAASLIVLAILPAWIYRDELDPQFERDRDACLVNAQGPQCVVVGGWAISCTKRMNAAPEDVHSRMRDSLFLACLEERGWMIVPK